MLAQDVVPIGIALAPVLGGFFAETFDILDDYGMGVERGKGDVGLDPRKVFEAL